MVMELREKKFWGFKVNKYDVGPHISHEIAGVYLARLRYYLCANLFLDKETKLTDFDLI